MFKTKEQKRNELIGRLDGVVVTLNNSIMDILKRTIDCERDILQLCKYMDRIEDRLRYN